MECFRRICSSIQTQSEVPKNLSIFPKFLEVKQNGLLFFVATDLIALLPKKQ